MGASRLAFVKLVMWMQDQFKDDEWRMHAFGAFVALLERKYGVHDLLCSCDESCKLHGRASLDMFTENNYKMLRNFVDYVERDLDTHLRLRKCDDKLLSNLLSRIRLMKQLYKGGQDGL